MTLFIKGKVQKVGFRYSVVDHVLSSELSIVGYVKNLPDGSVQVIAQGSIEALKELHRFCTKGPPRAEVREVVEELTPIKEKSYSDFVIFED